MSIRIFMIAAFLAKLGDALIVTPTTPYTKFEGESGFFYKCENPDLNGPQPAWDDSEGDPIYTISGGGSNRVYITETTSSTSCATPGTLCRFTRLHFRDVQIADSGLYACKANGHQTQTRNVYLYKIITFPLYDGNEEAQSLIYNTTATIYCSARPLDNGLDMFWQKDATSVGDTEKYNGNTFGQLTVKNVEVSDEGEYSCVAYYQDTPLSINKNIDVTVQVPPAWNGVPPRPRNVVINSDVTLVCAASGRPDPTVTWTDVTGGDRQEITDFPNVYELSSTGNRQLRIMNIQLPVSGNIIIIECRASNDPSGARVSTAITHTIQLTVLVPPSLTQQQVYTVDETAEGGNTRSFECANTDFRSQARLSFRRDGRTAMDELEIGPQPDDSRVVVTENSQTMALTLTISTIQREHEGIWTCYAESLAGDVWVDHMLLVEYKPIIDQSRTPSSTVSWEGRLTDLTCIFFGYPIPTVKWTRNNVELTALDVDFVPDLPPGSSTIQIMPENEDFGAYFCNGSNTKGFVNYRQELTKAERPSEPIGLRVTDETSSTISIQFSPPNSDGSLLIAGYTIEYRVFTDVQPTVLQYENTVSDETTCRRLILPILTGVEQECINYCEDSQLFICCPVVDRNICLERPVDQGYTELHLRGLRAESIYEIRVAARNELGTGDYTQIVTTSTEPLSLPDPPNIISKRVSDRRDRYTLRWIHPYDDGGSTVINYHVEYSQVESRDDYELTPRPVSVLVIGNSTALEINPLNQGKFYLIELRAETNLGYSDPAQILIETAGTFTFMTTPPSMFQPSNTYRALYHKTCYQ
eukprot:XP_011666728.1 PREDICTED: neural cell adhesion molecule 2 [Strongylocentrotus purpuratus]